MAFGFARVRREPAPRGACAEREAEAEPGGGVAPDALDQPSLPEFEHAHGDTCGCSLRGE